MNIRTLLLISAALLGLASLAAAQTQSTDATVAKFTGAVTIKLANGSAVALAVGAKVPQGATITTGADGEVYLQTHAGTVATVKANSTLSVEEVSVTTSGGKVTKETTALNLKSGNLVSALDPSKRSVNNYQVRTPKGVAAARGTTFTVGVTGTAGSYSVSTATTSGTVEITTPTGLVISIDAGKVSVSSFNNGAAVAVADLPAETKAAVVQAMAVAVGTIAVASQQGMLGAAGAAEVQAAATTVLTAAPEAAATVAATVAAVAPSQNSSVTAAAQTAAATTGNTSLSQTVQNTQANTPPASSTPPPPSTPSAPTAPSAPDAPVTTPQPIDPSTVSRSGE